MLQKAKGSDTRTPIPRLSSLWRLGCVLQVDVDGFIALIRGGVRRDVPVDGGGQ